MEWASSDCVVLEGREAIPHVQGQERQPRGDTLRPRSGAAAVLCWSSGEEILHIQGKGNPTKRVGIEKGNKRADRLNHNHRKLANLITWTTALSNSMKLSHAL